MRKQLVLTVEEVLQKNKATVLLLGDIGVFGFRKAFTSFPKRVYNIGILEQATISLAAGLASLGFIPIFHTIAPFLVERAYEQLKIDFGYQKLAGKFISVGASYDYAALGCTHHCPADIPALQNIPNMQIVVPGTGKEFDQIFKETLANKQTTYYRLSENENSYTQKVTFGKGNVIQKGKLASIIVVGPILDKIMSFAKDYDVTVLYFTTVEPFDVLLVKQNNPTNKFLVCEPYYSGALDYKLIKAFPEKAILIKHFGVPHQFLTHYGTDEEQNKFIGLTPNHAKKLLNELINL